MKSDLNQSPSREPFHCLIDDGSIQVLQEGDVSAAARHVAHRKDVAFVPRQSAVGLTHERIVPDRGLAVQRAERQFCARLLVVARDDGGAVIPGAPTEPTNVNARVRLQLQRGGDLHRFDRHALRRPSRRKAHPIRLNLHHRFPLVKPSRIGASCESKREKNRKRRPGAHSVISSR